MSGLLLIISVPLAILAPQILAVVKWRGIWRWLAAATLLIPAGDILLILVQTSIDPTSHNLWPLELIEFTCIGLLAVGVLWLARLVARAH
ncbi:hypothetical protein [Dongia deserti]|uniref:hypothetical protein n=1 Tax=Dongia deserti TaxID=2268030 RepID=UPI000E646034|nr:hypothetical protein [Dongia deserti]